MREVFSLLLRDEDGFVVSSELVLILTIGVIGLIVGLSSLQNAITTELADLANAIGDLNQTYEFNGWQQTTSGNGMTLLSFTKGSYFYDDIDTGDEQPTTGNGNNVSIMNPALEGNLAN